MNLVIIPFHDWKKCEREGFRTRDAHFMQEFGKHSLVDKMLVINRPISLSEMILMRRSWKPRKGKVLLQKNGVSITQVTPKIFILDILIWQLIKPIKMKRNWIPYIFGQQKVIDAVKTGLAYLGMDSSYSLFVSAPIFAPLIEQLAPSGLAFDAQDNLLKHAYYRDMPNLETYYQFCLNHAQFVSANSLETTTWFKEFRSDAVHIPNGVDDRMFSAENNYSVPKDMTAIDSPIVGYAGKMQEMFDRSLMIQAVQELPNIQFVFIGQQLDSDWMKPFWEHLNVHYLGDKLYKYLPQYLAAFDICIIPYNMERQHGGDPIKFYEYLAMGKPIVTTDIGNVSAFENYPQVRVASNTEEFVGYLRGFVKEIQNDSPIEISSVPEEHLWRTKADMFVKAMMGTQEI